ncbi:TPA: hypothetical protein ACYFFC_005772, partial [Klebsiella pneumoniae]
LAYYVGTGTEISEVLHVAEEKRRHRRVSRICDTGDIPLPRSLTRSARSFGCGEQYQLTGGTEISW